MKHKVIISSVVAAVLLAIVGFVSVGMTNEAQTSIELENSADSSKVSMVIEDNNYVVGGLLPPDNYILDFGDGLDLEENRGKNSPYYNDVKDVFPGYDYTVIIDHTRENDDPSYVEPLTTYIFLTKEPLKDETFSGEFYYGMVGISITITDKADYEQITMQTEKDSDDTYKEISKDGLIGIGREKFKGKMADGTEFDLPTRLSFVDNRHSVSIKGFLTLDQASELARAIRE